MKISTITLGITVSSDEGPSLGLYYLPGLLKRRPSMLSLGGSVNPKYLRITASKPSPEMTAPGPRSSPPPSLLELRAGLRLYTGQRLLDNQAGHEVSVLGARKQKKGGVSGMKIIP
jgi:hypothetical protein